MIWRWQGFSLRKQQACALLCLVYTNRQIAARLGVAEEMIKTHLCLAFTLARVQVIVEQPVGISPDLAGRVV